MATKNEQRWRENYERLKAYIVENRHLPDKKKVENRGLLNWWKYNKKMIKQGKLDPERIRLLSELSEMREL
ncbi:MAG: helicase associated domain-containing protein [Parabacteroides sp.]